MYIMIEIVISKSMQTELYCRDATTIAYKFAIYKKYSMSLSQYKMIKVSFKA